MQKVWNERRLPLKNTESCCASLPPHPHPTECEHLKPRQSSRLTFLKHLSFLFGPVVSSTPDYMHDFLQFKTNSVLFSWHPSALSTIS